MLAIKSAAIPAILLGGLIHELLAQALTILLHYKTNETTSFIGASTSVIAIDTGTNQELASAIGFVLALGIGLISIKCK